ncbi:MAG: tRNA (adenosine(37)-N6)-threonylcarbamoyltransferase complex dimerization subunit type 1 TsaB [Oscillospiraceae bacterium]|nr:tRNA (adenosine(37)-N6)-threonylcarbamoyltransferase complex dimerization subunit type 1 TsaB [Oscillospiraceae bacterium]
MTTLGIDTSALSACVAVMRDGVLLGECFARSGQTHSALLMPMAEQALKQAGLAIAQIDRFAVTNGPGSFTGVRIGVSAAKGMAQALGAPCAGVSALRAMAYNAVLCRGLLCCAMDARRGQVYAALFSSDGKTVARLTEDEAISREELDKKLTRYDMPVTFLENAPMRASGAILAAVEEDYKPADELRAVYLRPSQAERERAAQKK